MAVLDTGGSSIAAASAACALLLITSRSGSASSVAGTQGGAVLLQVAIGEALSSSSTSGTAVRLVKTVGSSLGAGAASGTIIRISKSAGVSIGRSQLASPSAAKYAVLSGSASGAGNADAYVSDRDVRDSLRRSTPPFLQEARTMQTIQDAQATETTRLLAITDQMLLDYFVDTASSNGIKLHETELGIKATEGKALDQRREAIKQRKIRPGILTRKGFKGQLATYHICSVDERSAEQRVVSTILSKRGVPSDIEEMEEMVDRVLPAHLEHEFIYTWLPWSEIEAANLTCEQAEAFGSCGALETAFLVPFTDPDEGG